APDVAAGSVLALLEARLGAGDAGGGAIAEVGEVGRVVVPAIAHRAVGVEERATGVGGDVRQALAGAEDRVCPGAGDVEAGRREIAAGGAPVARAAGRRAGRDVAEVRALLAANVGDVPAGSGQRAADVAAVARFEVGEVRAEAGAQIGNVAAEPGLDVADILAVAGFKVGDITTIAGLHIADV